MRYVYLLLLVLLVSPVLAADAPAGYQYYRQITLGGDLSWAGDLSNYPVQLMLFKGSGSSSGDKIYLNDHSVNWPNDVRFTKLDNTTLSYWVEQYNATSARVWVEVDSISRTSDSNLFIYYGSSGATSVSNGTDTFTFFDDFNDADLDEALWTTSGSVEEASGSLHVYDTGGSGSLVTSVTEHGGLNTSWFVSTYSDLVGSDTQGAYGGLQDTGDGYKGDWFYFKYSNASQYQKHLSFDSHIAVASPTLAASTWYRVEHARTKYGADKYFGVSQNDTWDVIQNQVCVYDGDGFFRLYARKASTNVNTYYDYVVVRPRMHVEPSFDSISSEWAMPANTTIMRGNVTISSTGDVSDYQIKFHVNNSVGVSSGTTLYVPGANANLSDVRFYNSEMLPLYQWLADGTLGSGVGDIYVRIPSLATGDNELYYVWNYDNAVLVSDGYATFPEFFDDFNDASVNASAWVAYTAGTAPTISEADGVLTVSTTELNVEKGVMTTANLYEDGYTYESATYVDVVNSLGDDNYIWQVNDDGYYNVAAFFSGHSAPYINTYGNYNTGWSTTAIAGATQDAWNLVTVERNSSAARWLINDTNPVIMSTQFPVGHPGHYALQVRSGTGGSILVKSNYVLKRTYYDGVSIGAYGPADDVSSPIPGFVANSTSGYGDVWVAFTDQSYGPVTSWEWNFGDGTSNSTDQSPTHHYTTTGLFDVTLTISDGVSESSLQRTAYIDVDAALNITFSANVTSGSTPLHVAFTASDATYALDAVYWDVDDDGDYDGTGNPYTHIYDLAYIYDVRCYAANGTQTDGYSRTSYITATSGWEYLPLPSMSANDTSPYVWQDVLFDANPTNPATGWNWSFGDGDTSTEQFPVHSYDASGTYEVAVNCSNAWGWGYQDEYYITVGLPPTPTPTTATPTPTPMPSPTAQPGVTTDSCTPCADVYTYPASNTTSVSVTMRGRSNVSGGQWCYFDWGASNGSYALQTEAEWVVGNYSAGVSGIPIMPGHWYYYRAHCDCGCANNSEAFYASAATPIPTSTLTEEYFDPFDELKWNMTAIPALAGAIVAPFTTPLGGVLPFYTILWAFIFTGLWLRQENMLVPAVLFALLSAAMVFTGVVAPQMIYAGWVVLAVTAALAFYMLWKRGGD